MLITELDPEELERLHKEDVMKGRMVWVGAQTTVDAQHLSFTELDFAIEKYHMEAVDRQEKTGADHVIYCEKLYDSNNNLQYAFLGLTEMSDAEYRESHIRASEANSVVFAVHSKTIKDPEPQKLPPQIAALLEFSCSVIQYPFENKDIDLTRLLRELEEAVFITKELYGIEGESVDG